MRQDGIASITGLYRFLHEVEKSILPEQFPIFFWRHAEFLFKGAEEAGIILESEHKVCFADFLAAQYGIPAHHKPFLGDKLMDGQADMFFKYMGNMIFADIEFSGQLIQRQLLIQMGFNILH